MSHLLAEKYDGKSKHHDEDVNASLSAECVDVACLGDPGDNGVEEAECDNILGLSVKVWG